MLEGKAVIRETDMLQAMQQEALTLASKALDSFDVTEPTDIARFIKMVWSDLFNSHTQSRIDRTYGGGWQCIVGTDFGSFVTHCSGCLLLLRRNPRNLLFRGSSGPEAEPSQFMTALETSVPQLNDAFDHFLVFMILMSNLTYPPLVGHMVNINQRSM
ncbi:uncharacterized protein J3R85_009354 [Psidium guajava]|nr:uncharacterized protein J3R85_009354 [Psidium guajava]